MKEEPINNCVFTIKDDKGVQKECEVLFTFDSSETMKSYVVYTDHTKSDNGLLNVEANIYLKNGNSRTLLPIETEEEWNTIESILAKLEEKEESSK